MDAEQSTVSAFIVPERRDRWLWMLGSPKRRKKIRDRLAHCRDFDPGYAHRIPDHEQTARGVLSELQRRGAPTFCHIVSEDTDLDGKDLPLEEALDSVLGHQYGTLIVCLPGKLAYYEGEDPKERYILENGA